MKIYKFISKTSPCKDSLWILKKGYLIHLECKGDGSCCTKKIGPGWHEDKKAALQQVELPEHLIPKAMIIAMKGDYYG